MPVNTKKPASISKGQRSIIEFTRIGNDTDVQTHYDACEAIDLTDDIESRGMKTDEGELIGDDKTEIILERKSDIEDVNCPMCNRDLVDLSMDDRIRHIEECLSLVTLKETEPKTTSELSDTIKKERITKISKKKLGLLEDKRRIEQTLKSDKDNGRGKYLNKRMKTEDPKIKAIKPPTTVSASKPRAQIPGVKVLTFPVSGSADYQVAVDAFNYSPHETINKYFLTHFHSDHYGGITKKWCYERVFEEGDDFEDESKYKKIIFCSKITAKLLNLRFSIDRKFIMPLEMNQRHLIHRFDQPDIEKHDGFIQCSDMISPGLFVTPMPANHCPGSVIFLFESLTCNGLIFRILHCGDFRANREMLDHHSLLPFNISSKENLYLDKVYLDTTYMSPLYNFPKQELVCKTVSDMFYNLTHSQGDTESNESLLSAWFGVLRQSRITDFMMKQEDQCRKKKFLILIGTYVIGKERLAISILQRLNNCPIYVLAINSRNDKIDLIRSYDDNYLDRVITDDELGGPGFECMIHLVPMKIVSSIEELSNYFNHNKYFEQFERCVGLRPTGWSFLNKCTPSKAVPDGNENQNESRTTCQNLIQLMKTQPMFSFIENILPQSPLLSLISKSKKRKHDESLYRIYTLPYSEHSSYRELSFFSIFLKIREIIPTVNISDESSVIQMNNIIRIWEFIREYKMNEKSSYGLDTIVAKAVRDLCIDDF